MSAQVHDTAGVSLDDPTPTEVRRHLITASVGGAAVATAVVAAWFLIGTDVMVIATVVGAPAVAAASITFGVGRYRPQRSVSWLLLAGGCAVHAIATGILAAEADHDPSGRPWLGHAFAILAYPALFTGVLGITTRHPGTWSTQRSTAIGATALATTLIGLALTLRYVTHGEFPLAEDWPGPLVLADAVLAAVALRRVVHAHRRNWTWWLLAAGFVTWGNGHGEIGNDLSVHSDGSGSIAILLLVAGPLLVGASGLSSGMAVIPSPSDAPSTRRWAMWLTLPLIALAALHVAETSAPRLWLIVPALTCITAAVARTASLVASLDQFEESTG